VGLDPDVAASAILVIALAVLVGAFVQSVVGLGVGLVSAPVIALVEPSLLPALPLWFGLAVATMSLASEHSHVDWRVVAWSLPARLPGTALGVWLVTLFTPDQLSVALAVVVLAAVVLSVRTVEVAQNPRTLSAAGFVSGAAGSATSIGGPPMAIVLQHRPPAVARSTMAFFFVVGSSLSLSGLAITGSLPRSALVAAVLVLPMIAAGFWLGARVRHRLPRSHFRRAVLVVCAVAAVVLVVRSLV
jgi:uncharacterized membrane protein YfcA